MSRPDAAVNVIMTDNSAMLRTALLQQYAIYKYATYFTGRCQQQLSNTRSFDHKRTCPERGLNFFDCLLQRVVEDSIHSVCIYTVQALTIHEKAAGLVYFNRNHHPLLHTPVS
ncbi:hypothetical protein [Acetobacter thailandicus]|uniref:Uncharacterized protein n=1 Tax=Acetobacter thailandicus TaxID=1502842 RepID=A0ABT3QH28_9PROT|nr:hypothetical protein [Acetobacter thailandicus]MCX2564586.1 hypothetical protein [Acetobacter thailandicus]NHN95948.1 hypothetical protein [Acetobacter thailandicus]